MKEISLAQFKSAFDSIAELVVSLDKDHKAILKSRKEIDMYLKSQIPEWQELIIGELKHVLFLNAISKSYLLNDQKEYGTRISFENYLMGKLRSATNHIEHNNFLQDDLVIKNLKENLKGFAGKDAKINFLLEKKRDLGGDYPEAFGEILTKNEIYLFLNREIEYWEKYREISTKRETNIPQQLKTSLTEPKRDLLFDRLVMDGFIPKNTDKEGFKWVFGWKNDKYTSFQIKWLKNKQLLRELLIPLRHSDIIQADYERLVPIFFIDKKENYISLAKGKHIESTDSDKIAEIHKKLANC